MSLARLGGNSDVYVYGQGDNGDGRGEGFTVQVGNKAHGKKFEPYTWTVYGPAACEKLLRDLVAKGARVPESVFKELYEENHD